MTNPIITTDIVEVLNKLDTKIESGFEKINSKLSKMDDRLQSIEVSQARLEEKLVAQEKIVSELKGSQNKQIWALIVLAFTAVVSLVIGLGKFLFFPNP